MVESGMPLFFAHSDIVLVTGPPGVLTVIFLVPGRARGAVCHALSASRRRWLMTPVMPSPRIETP